MKNSWNKIIYKLWSPVYDTFFNSGHFLHARKKVFQDLIFESNQKILFVGIGTGADLEQVNYQDMDITAIDFSPDMLEKAKAKYRNSSIKFLEMDAQNMNFEDKQFDVIIASLILSVVPDPAACLREMARVLKPNGEIIVFDKFLPTEQKVSFSKKTVRPFIKLLGTDIGLNFEELLVRSDSGLLVRENLPIMFDGMYKRILLGKPFHPPANKESFEYNDMIQDTAVMTEEEFMNKYLKIVKEIEQKFNQNEIISKEEDHKLGGYSNAVVNVLLLINPLYEEELSLIS